MWETFVNSICIKRTLLYSKHKIWSQMRFFLETDFIVVVINRVANGALEKRHSFVTVGTTYLKMGVC